MLQVAVLANHQNGRDTHVRQVGGCVGARSRRCISATRLARCPCRCVCMCVLDWPLCKPLPLPRPLQVRVFGPRSTQTPVTLGHEVSFTSAYFSSYSTVR